MPPFGLTLEERKHIINEIVVWMESCPKDWDWTKSGIKVTDKKYFNWSDGDIIDVQKYHIKIFIALMYKKEQAKNLTEKPFYNFYSLGGNKHIVYKYQFFPKPEKALEILGDNWRMEIISYDGALRIYKQLTGNKLDGFDGFGRGVYY